MDDESVIKQLKIMRGPNMWSSAHQHLLVIKLSQRDAGVAQRELLCKTIAEHFPALGNHVIRLNEDPRNETGELFLAACLALISAELQTASGAGVVFYDTARRGERSYFALVEYKDEEHGKECAYVAADLLHDILENRPVHHLSGNIQWLGRMYERNAEGPSSMEIINEARSRGIPVNKGADGRFTLLGQGKFMHKIQAAISDRTALLGVNAAGDKSFTKQLLDEAMLPVPQGKVITDEEQLDAIVERFGYPLVTKPLNGNQGKCITTDITKYETLLQGFRLAKSYSRQVIVEQFVKGDDYRFLVVDYKLVAASKRSPALVTGDGKRTIAQLIDQVNADPLRADGHSGVLTRITVDDITHALLALNGRTLDTVLPEGEVQVLKDTANLSTGGTAVDVTDEVHPANVRFAERAARVIGLDICGIDIMAPDVTTPFTKNGGAIIEVNAAPGLRMHFAPSAGKARKVGKAIIDMLYKNGSDGRIPIVAITGTNGKTTTCRLMAHVAQAQGHVTGFTATEGIYIGGEQIVSGDCSGPRSSAVVLQDTSVEFAVLECARGGIIRNGLAFDACDIGIVTNIAPDHLGLEDIYSVEDMAQVKSVIPQSVKPGGYAILNASIDLVREMRKGLKCKVALFSLDPDNPHIISHCENGGLAAVREKDGSIVIIDGDKRIFFDDAANLPFTLEGKAGFMVENALPVILASYALKFDGEKVREALRAFRLSAEKTPGRLNIIEIGNVHVMVDYAHNPHSVNAFAEFMRNITAHKTGIITGVGDRRDEDIREIGRLAASMYNEVIIRIDKDTRGRKPEEISKLISEGIRSADPNLPVRVIPDIREALIDALHTSQPGSYIILNADSVQETIEMVMDVKENLLAY